MHFSAAWLLTSTGDVHSIQVRDGDDLMRVVAMGAAHLYPHSLIDNCRSKHRLEVPLTSDGTNVTATMHFSAAWLLTSTGDVHSIQVRDGDDLMRVVAINIFSVSPKDLPQIDAPIDGYYCKLLLESMKPGESGLITMPSLDMKLPFTFKLPDDLPTNLDTEHGSSIRYSLKCSLEGNAELPTAVCHFGVVQPIPSSIPALATPRTAQSSRKSLFCSCGSPIKMSTRLDRSGYAPGDLMRIHLKGDNALKVPIEIQIDLVRTHRINLGRKEWRFSRGFSLLSPLSVEMKQKFNFDLEIPFPSVPPTYEGLDDEDPLTWDYQLAVNVEARQSVVLTHCATVVAAALPTEVFSEQKGDLVENSKIEKSPRFSKETRVILGNWRDVVAEEGIEASIRFVSDQDEQSIRANNKFVRGGECVEVPFVSSYPSGRAPPKGRNDAH